MDNSKRLIYCVDGGLINGSIPILEQSLYWCDAGWETHFVSRTRSSDFAQSNWDELFDVNLKNIDWWRTHHATHAVFYSLSARPEYMMAARNAGLVVTIDADNECILSPRMSLSKWHNRYSDARHGLIMRLKMFKMLFIDRFAAKRLERGILSRLEACNYLKVESPAAAENVLHLLRILRRQDLASKVIQIPFPVRSEFTKKPILRDREFAVAIMGRLNDQQKDPAVLLVVLRFLLETRPIAKFVVMTREVTEPFQQLAEKFCGRVKFIQGATRETVAEFLSCSAVYLSTSRIESLPVAALEAACVGCAVVGTPLAGFQYLCSTLGYGQQSLRHTADSILVAYRKIESELAPDRFASIASDARERFSLEAVTRSWVRHFESHGC